MRGKETSEREIDSLARPDDLVICLTGFGSKEWEGVGLGFWLECGVLTMH